MLIYLSNFRAIENVYTRTMWLRDFTRSGGKTSYRLVNRSPVLEGMNIVHIFHVFIDTISTTGVNLTSASSEAVDGWMAYLR